MEKQKISHDWLRHLKMFTQLALDWKLDPPATVLMETKSLNKRQS